MEASGAASMGMMIIWMVIIFGIMYFLMIRPQKKRAEKTSGYAEQYGSRRQRCNNKRFLRCCY